MPALGFDFERTLSAPLPAVGTAIAAALRDAGFRITAQQLTRVEAKRGSKLLGDALTLARMLPLAVTLDLSTDGSHTAVVGHFVDEHINIAGRAWGWNDSYRKLFSDALARVDASLAKLDPAAAAGFAPGAFWTHGGDIGVLEAVQSRSSDLSGAILDKANTMLEGGTHDDHPAEWKGIGTVAVTSSKGRAQLSLDDTEAFLGVAVMIDSDAASLPPNLRKDVEVFAARVEGLLSAANSAPVALAVTPPEEPVLAFLREQARIRDGLPARTLHVCRTCHFEKITNEDYERVTARNKVLTTVIGSVGASIGSGGIRPFFVLGQLFRLKKLDPDYVCPRCQGMEADEHLVTFCPQCGDMRREAALRICPKCRYDFRSALAPEAFWEPDVVALAAPTTQPVAVMAQHAAAPAGLPIQAPPPLPLQHLAATASSQPADAPSAPTAAPPVASTLPAAGPSAGAGGGFCPFCGAHVGAGFAFCPSCGQRLPAPGVTQAAT